MKWEYRVETSMQWYPGSQCRELNDAGKEGWELVSVVEFDRNFYYYLKRLVKEN